MVATNQLTGTLPEDLVKKFGHLFPDHNSFSESSYPPLNSMTAKSMSVQLVLVEDRALPLSWNKFDTIPYVEKSIVQCSNQGSLCVGGDKCISHHFIILIEDRFTGFYSKHFVIASQVLFIYNINSFLRSGVRYNNNNNSMPNLTSRNA